MYRKRETNTLIVPLLQSAKLANPLTQLYTMSLQGRRKLFKGGEAIGRNVTGRTAADVVFPCEARKVFLPFFTSCQEAALVASFESRSQLSARDNEQTAVVYSGKQQNK